MLLTHTTQQGYFFTSGIPRQNPLRALSAAIDLLENNNVQAIMGPGTSPEANLLAALGDKAKVPILSFTRRSPTSSSLMLQDSMTSPNILNLDSFRGLFLISGISSALALVIFLIGRVKNYIRKLFLEKLVFMLKYLFAENTIMH
ncbi:glutamate receptor 2.1-like [Cornus florida]|uniref:glutamate receptor 2.1-like n=1 Tax=Cornus florida TaxID=4283 RepID=UPI00289C42D1|nr:glutamate receptor 2.1-like [Cornus florida]